MMRIAIAALVALTAVNATAVDWAADVRALARELPKRHLNAFHTVTREQFDREVAAALAKAPAASDSEMYVTLARIAAMVGDGHTYVHIAPTARRFPIGIARFDDAWRVANAAVEYRNVLGTKLVRIHETPIDDVAKRMEPLIPQVTDALIRGQLPAFLVLGDALHGLGITPSRDKATLVFQRDDGSEFSLDVGSVAYSERTNWIFASEKTPLARMRPMDEPLWFQSLDNGAVYVMWRRYDDMRAKTRELWKYVDANKVKKLVIDMRPNGGGDYFVGRKFIVDEVKKRPQLHVVALIGPRTYSAAVVNAIDLRNAGATLAGLTIGEKPNGYSENDEFTLPSSKLVVSYSTRFYKFVPDDAPNVVKPDKEVSATWADFVAGRDPAIEWALSASKQ